MYKFRCGFRTDNKLFSMQQQLCAPIGKLSAISYKNIPLNAKKNYFQRPVTDGSKNSGLNR